MNHISAQILANAATRRTQFEGRDTLVAPVILLVEGVHAGSNGPLYYPSSVLRAYAQAWNGVPLPVHHPEQDGQPVSCNSPDVIQTRSVGRLWNVKFEESPKPRLKGEIWVDVVKCASVAPEVLEALKSNRPLEVSTGLFSTDEIGAGTWNTEDYHATVKDMRPDHLALLPGVTGACSWQDGCGVRANKAGGDMAENEEKGFFKNLLVKANSVYKRWTENEMSLDDKSTAIRRAIYTLDTPTQDNYIKSIYDDFVVYECQPGHQSVPGSSAPRKTYKRNYTIDENGKVTLGDDVVEVKEETVYTPVENVARRAGVNPEAGEEEYGDVPFADEKNNKYPIDTEAHIRAAWNYINMPKNAVKYDETDVKKIKAKIVGAWKKKIAPAGPPAMMQNESELNTNQEEVITMATEERKVKVNALISNGSFTEGDRAFLEGCDCPQFSRIEGLAAKATVNAKPADPATYEQLLANAPQEVKDQHAFVQAQIKANRERLVARIKANANNKLTDEVLAGMKDDMLQGIADSIAPVTNYAGVAGGAQVVNAGAEEVLALPSHEVEKK